MVGRIQYGGTIPVTVDGFIGFLKQGAEVARRVMNAAVHVMNGDECHDTFYRVCNAQMEWLNFVGRETHGVSRFLPEMSPRDEARVACFRHNRVDALNTKISMLLQLLQERGKMTERLSRIARSSFHYQRDISSIVGGIISSYEYDIKRKKIEVTLNIEGGDQYFISPAVHDCFDDTLTNLISNAVKYCGEGRELHVTRDGCMITVADRGIGMAPAFFERVLTPVPCREHRAENVQGEGWGMVSVGDMVDELGWTIRGSSVLNEGTEWKLEIPEHHFVSREAALMREDPLPSNISLRYLDNLARGVEILSRVKPFAGYQRCGDMLNVHCTPISTASRMTAHLS